MRNLPALLLPLLLPLAPTAAQDGPPAKDGRETIRLTSRLVVLNLTVTDAQRHFVSGLNQQDFQVAEDGVEQTISYFGAEETPFAAAIIVDVSGSMRGMVRIAYAAARDFADKMRRQDVFAVYVFDHRVAQVQDFDAYPELDDRIWGIQPQGYTALYDAIERAVQDLSQRPERRRAMLVLSDGADTRSRHSLDSCLQAASEASVTLYTVSLMDRRTSRAVQAAGILRAMAQKTGGRFINDPGGAGMYQAFNEIVEELSHQYTIGYFPTPAKRDGKWHKIKVEICDPGLNVRTRQGYRAVKSG